ncbi:MAG: ABC transporter permease [Alicyclobacillaceae bacterium]|nr:ABC transporter permease [Alicyclobacillaceae bacterium]
MKGRPVELNDAAVAGAGRNIRLRLANSKFRIYIPVLSASVALLILGQILSPGFASASNIGNLLATAVVLAIASFGQTLVVISGQEGIDLSIGAMMSMGALIGVQVSDQSSLGLWGAVLLLIGTGALVGLIHAVCIQFLRIPPLVMTLGMATVVDGFALAYTKGLPSGTAPKLLTAIGIGHVGPIRTLLLFGIAMVVIGEFVLRRTRYGRNLYLAGSNRMAAALSGIHVNVVVFVTYVIAGIAGTLGGLVMLGFVGTAQLGMGDGYTLLSIAAVVIGGTALAGGEGTFLGSALGAVVLTILTSVLLAVGMQEGVRELIQGAILLLVLAIYSRAPKLRQ